jgi:glycerophosphoryl diester phosphodiesterase
VDAPGPAPYHAYPFRREDRPLVYAHRGASAAAPENTVAAFAAARRLGADAVECDVMACKSGELVVCHDERLDRLAGIPAAVRDLPLAALRELAVLAERFPGTRAGIPTLAEAVEAGGPDLVWNIELKVDRAEDAGPLARAAVDEVASLDLDGRLLISSFHPVALLVLREVAPWLPTAFLWEAPARPIWHGLLGLALSSTAVHPEATLVDARVVRRWHRWGKLVDVWTVDEPDEIRRLAAIGVDGIVTNRPDVALAALSARET